MPNCLKCDYLFPPKELSDGYCKECLHPVLVQKYQDELKKEQELREIRIEKYNAIMLTRKTTIKEDIEPIELISSKCMYRLNKKKHIFSSIIDVIVGSSKPSENSIKDAKNKVMNNFKKQAFLLGGDAVIAIKTSHTHKRGTRNVIMAATGTVVKLKVS